MTTIDESRKTITRDGMTWTLRDTRLTRLVREYGPDMVARVLTERDYYPPMIDSQERLDIEERLESLYVASAYMRSPAIQPTLEALNYTREEATATLND